MLGNINYPVKVKLIIALKNSERFAFTCNLDECEKQLIEKLYNLAVRVREKTDPRQLPLPAGFPKRVKLQSGAVVETKDGVNWQEVVEPRQKYPKVVSKADCNVYGYHCGTDKCPYALIACSDREKGIEASDLERAKVVTKRKRGRPKKSGEEKIAEKAAKQRAKESREIESCAHYPRDCESSVRCPRGDADCYRRSEGRRVNKKSETIKQAEKMPKHSGELCKGKVAECEYFCTSVNCVHWQKPLTYWAVCKGAKFPDDCGKCTEARCVLRNPPENQLCAIQNRACDECDNPYCPYSHYQSNEYEERIVPVEVVHGVCKNGVSISCIDECQDADCRYHHGIPMCKTGFPKLCNTTCEQDKCVFYRWNK